MVEVAVEPRHDLRIRTVPQADEDVSSAVHGRAVDPFNLTFSHSTAYSSSMVECSLRLLPSLLNWDLVKYEAGRLIRHCAASHIFPDWTLLKVLISDVEALMTN